jgi:hypothetical protein
VLERFTGSGARQAAPDAAATAPVTAPVAGESAKAN